MMEFRVMVLTIIQWVDSLMKTGASTISLMVSRVGSVYQNWDWQGQLGRDLPRFQNFAVTVIRSESPFVTDEIGHAVVGL